VLRPQHRPKTNELVCSPSAIRPDPIAEAEVSGFPFDTCPEAYRDA
jgi:hypothetical protein